MLRKPKVLVTPLETMVATTASISVTLKVSLICLSTLTLDSRPWWQVIQSASPSSPALMILPDGKVTDTIVDATGLWQVTHMKAPAGAGMPLATLPVATNSLKPAELWHRAHAVGTSAGLASFQSLNANAFASAWPEALKTVWN